MSIKNDNWIKQMSIEHDMINPFVDDQTKKIGDKSIISFGTSSYGYDVRVLMSLRFLQTLILLLLTLKVLIRRALLIIKGMFALYLQTHLH